MIIPFQLQVLLFHLSTVRGHIIISLCSLLIYIRFRLTAGVFALPPRLIDRYKLMSSTYPVSLLWTCYNFIRTQACPVIINVCGHHNFIRLRSFNILLQLIADRLRPSYNR